VRLGEATGSRPELLDHLGDLPAVREEEPTTCFGPISQETKEKAACRAYNGPRGLPIPGPAFVYVPARARGRSAYLLAAAISFAQALKYFTHWARSAIVKRCSYSMANTPLNFCFRISARTAFTSPLPVPHGTS
jgi:hypothetical protein